MCDRCKEYQLSGAQRKKRHVWSLREISIIKCAERGETCVVAAGDINYQVLRRRRDMCGRCGGYQLSSAASEKRHVWSLREISIIKYFEKGDTCVVVAGGYQLSSASRKERHVWSQRGISIINCYEEGETCVALRVISIIKCIE